MIWVKVTLKPLTMSRWIPGQEYEKLDDLPSVTYERRQLFGRSTSRPSSSQMEPESKRRSPKLSQKNVMMCFAFFKHLKYIKDWAIAWATIGSFYPITPIIWPLMINSPLYHSTPPQHLPRVMAEQLGIMKFLSNPLIAATGNRGGYVVG